MQGFFDLGLRRLAPAGLLACLLAATCEEEVTPNLAPSVTITSGAMGGEEASYLATFEWQGSDPDGVVDHYLYAIETLDALRARRAGGGTPLVWLRTDETSGTFPVPATTPGDDPTTTHDLTAFHIKAVDDDARESPEDVAVFDAVNVRPSAWFTSEALFDTPANVCEDVTLRWRGRDIDAPDGDAPTGYQMKLVEVDHAAFFDAEAVPEAQVVAWLVDEDSLRANLLVPADRAHGRARPAGRRTGDTSGDATGDASGDSTAYLDTDWYPSLAEPHPDPSFTFPSPGKGLYMFAVRAVDAAGTVTPPEAFATFRDPPGPEGAPVGAITIAGLDMRNAQAPGDSIVGLRLDESSLLGSHVLMGGDEGRVEVPINVPLNFTWQGIVSPNCDGAELLYDFALDLPDPGCEVCTDPDGIGGWIGWGPHLGFGQPITFDETQAGEQHILWIRMMDTTGALPPVLFALRMDVIGFDFDEPALLVDDAVFSGGPDDCEHDAFVTPMVEQAIAPFLEPGEELDIFASHPTSGSPCSESSVIAELSLSRLSRYRTVFWVEATAGSGSALAAAERSRALDIYVRSGGNLVVWGRSAVLTLAGGPLTNGSVDPFGSPPAFGPGDFAWDILHLRTRLGLVTVPSGTFPPACDGLVGLEATPLAAAEGFPDGAVDPTGYSPARTALWIDDWLGAENPTGIAASAVIGPPALHEGDLDTLYKYVSNAWAYEKSGTTGDVCAAGASAFEGKPLVMRYRDPAGVHGDVVWLGAPLYVFAQSHADDLHLMMRRIAEWIHE